MTLTERLNPVAKTNPSFQKRLRERKKQEQREEKARKRAERIADKGDGTGDTIVTDLSDIVGPLGDEVAEDESEEEKDGAD
ncbi:MAG: hypothetical protein AAF628_29545 [Planctomycetota bacterium]